MAKAYGYICMRIHTGQGTYAQDAYGAESKTTKAEWTLPDEGEGTRGASRAEVEEIEKRGSDAGEKRARSRG